MSQSTAERYAHIYAPHPAALALLRSHQPPSGPPTRAILKPRDHSIPGHAIPAWALAKVLHAAAHWLERNACHEDAPTVSSHLDRVAPGWRRRHRMAQPSTRKSPQG